MSDREPFNASICEGVTKGICVVLEDHAIIYAGPIKSAPFIDGKMVLLHPEDFEKLKAYVEKRRH